MAENKTKQTKISVDKFINGIKDETVRKDCYEIIKLMKSVTKEEPKMWGPSIIGFGSYHYKYESGREGDSCLTGFSPRKQNLTIYLMGGFEKQKAQLEKLGKYKTSKACLYIKSLNDIDVKVLKEMIVNSINYMKKTYLATEKK
jgi:hypothetical protein